MAGSHRRVRAAARSRYLKRPAVGTRIEHGSAGAVTVEMVHDRHGLTVTVRDAIGQAWQATRHAAGWWARADG